MERSNLRTSGVAFLALFVCTLARGVPYSQNAGEAIANGSPGVGLHLSTNSKVFRCGQVIPLDLSFTSTTPDRYVINQARYDRSGRMEYERFIVTPKEGTRDPLQLYFGSIGGWLGGGLTGFKFLSPSATLIKLNLNEWVTFEKPGIYEVRVISRRVNDIRAGQNSYGSPIELQSNTIELKIIAASVAWQKAELAEIVEVLDRPTAAGVSSDNANYSAALTALRYLGSKEAARELARHLRGDNSNTDWQCMFGLIGSPHREAGLQEMNNLLEDPEFPVTGMFLDTMAILQLDPSENPQSLRQQRQENLQAFRQTLAQDISLKTGKALAVSLDALMSGPGGEPSAGGHQMLAQLVRVFPQLPVNKQTEWLQYRWNEIKGPNWIPVLRSIASRYQDFPEFRESHAYESLQLTGEALLRWYQLDPQGARPAILAEIKRPKPRYNARILGILPDKTLPGEEQAIAENFAASDSLDGQGNLGSLLFRYADASVLPIVLPEVETLVGKWACTPQEEALAYILKVDPVTARPLIQRAIEARGPNKNACRHMVFTDIGMLQTSPILENLAIRSLDDPDPEVVGNAAEYLGLYGSANAEQALWDRYENWSRNWSGHESELRFIPGKENPDVWAAGLGQNLAHALASGVGWLADAPKLRRIEALGVGPNIRQEMERDIQAWRQQPLAINYIDSVPPTFSIAQYQLPSLKALKTKLAEFPRGTSFFLPLPGANATADELRSDRQILNLAKEDGFTVVRSPRH